jgi:hypothetical protein
MQYRTTPVAIPKHVATVPENFPMSIAKLTFFLLYRPRCCWAQPRA